MVFYETNRISDAEASVKDARRVGFKVNPHFEQAIKDRKTSRQ